LQNIETRRRGVGALVEHRRDDFGDDVAGASHDHGVADAHVLAIDFVLVVQGGVGHRHAANEYRGKARHGRQRPGAAHLHLDAEHRGELLLCRILVCHRPARLARDEPQFALLIEAVDLVHHAVDVERQLVAARGDVVVEGDKRIRATAHLALGAHRDAELLQRVECRAVGVRRLLPAPHLAEAIGVERQRALRGNCRIELADAPRCAVARVDQGGLARFALPRVVALEFVAPHEHLAAHFQHGGREFYF
jgi:hypothetical protein